MGRFQNLLGIKAEFFAYSAIAQSLLTSFPPTFSHFSRKYHPMVLDIKYRGRNSRVPVLHDGLR